MNTAPYTMPEKSPVQMVNVGSCRCLRHVCYRHHAPQVLLAVLLQAFAVSGLYLLTAWLPSYFMQLAGMTPSSALLMHTLNMAALTGSMPLGGLLADEWERTPLLLATCVTAVGFGYPAWLLFSLGVAEVTWFAQCILCVLVGLHWGALAGALVDLFPLGVSGGGSNAEQRGTEGSTTRETLLVRACRASL